MTQPQAFILMIINDWGGVIKRLCISVLRRSFTQYVIISPLMTDTTDKITHTNFFV